MSQYRELRPALCQGRVVVFNSGLSKLRMDYDVSEHENNVFVHLITHNAGFSKFWFLFAKTWVKSIKE